MTAAPRVQADSASKFSILPLSSSDIDAVAAAEQRIYEFPWTRGNFADSLAAGNSAWLMREAPGMGMLGYAIMMLVLDEAHLLNISIVPECQKSGFGSMLLGHLLAVARKQNVAKMLLEVRLSNGHGRGFYARHGFVQIGERPDYYPARRGREAAVVMERAI